MGALEVRNEEGGKAMPIYLRGEIWYINIRHNGQRIQETTGTKDREAALRLHDEIKANLWKEKHLDEPMPRTFSEAVDKWLTENQHKKYIKELSYNLSWLVDQIGGMAVSKINKRIVESLLEKKQKRKNKDGKPLSNATVNRAMSALSVILKGAKKCGWIDSVPNIRQLDEAKRPEVFFTREQVVEIVSRLPMHHACIFSFAILTGQRMSNIIRLKWSSIDMENSCYWITSDDFKSGKAHNVPLNAEAMEVIKMCAGMDEEYVFVFRGKPLKRVSGTVWSDLLEEMGLKGKMRFHDTRHTWASFHTMGGTPKAVLQELGGWKTASMVEKYSHLAPGFAAKYSGNVKFNK